MEKDLTSGNRLLPVLTGIFCSVLVLIPSMSSKFISIGGLNIAGSTLVFPITFIFNDIFTEVYGYKKSRRIIWTGMVMQIFAALFYWLIDIWQPASFWSNQDCYHSILGQAPRLVLASLSAYLFGEFANSIILSKLKYNQNGEKGAKQAIRFVLSTVVGEGFDSLIFMTVGFFGVINNSDLIKTILTIWSIKVAYEVIILPVSIPISNWIKRIEDLDVIDEPEVTSYNPFRSK